MNFFVFDNDINALKVDDYNILLVKEFSDLWDLERNKTKEDKTGKKRTRAMKELTYLYLMLDFKSPYFKYVERDKHEAAMEDSGLKESDLKDEKFITAFRKYKEIQDSDPILSVIQTGYRTLRKMQVFFDSIDFNTDVDENGKPLYKPADILKDLKGIEEARTNLMALEEKHKAGLAASERKVRGGETPGLLDS